MGSDDDDEESCLETCKKIPGTIANYGGSFLAVAFSFVAFDVANNSAPMADKTGWIKDFNVDVWTGPGPHIYHIMKALTGAAVICFSMELILILMNYGGIYKLLKYTAIFHAVLIVAVVMPICIVGFVLGAELLTVSKLPEKITGSLFDSYLPYKNLVDASKNTSFSDSLADKLADAQLRIDWMQEDYHCCGVNSIDDWQGLHPHFNFNFDEDPYEAVPARLQWWLSEKLNEESNETRSNDTRLPKSCCSAKHHSYCYKSFAFPHSCKRELVELLVRCIMFASGLLLGAALFGGMGAIAHVRKAIAGIATQERYRAWLLKTGQLDQMNDD